MSNVAKLSPWHEEVQRIRLATFGRGIRLVGFTSTRANSGVTSLCKALATVTAASGLRTLLVDLSEAPGDVENTPVWLPGSGGALVAIPSGPTPFDKLTARTTPENRDLFNNSAQLRRTLMDELADYAAVIVDLAPIKPRFPGAVELDERGCGLRKRVPGLYQRRSHQDRSFGKRGAPSLCRR